MFEYGLAQEDITPDYGIPFYGYFNLYLNERSIQTK